METADLEKLIKENNEKLTVFNASYALPSFNPRIEHIRQRIPTSIMFDFEAFSCQKANFANAVPSEAQFKEQMQLLNVRKNDIVVVYDKIGKVSAPRAFWMLKTFGIENVAILNGSFTKWAQENRPVEDGDHEKAWKRIRETKADKGDFDFKFDQTKVSLY